MRNEKLIKGLKDLTEVRIENGKELGDLVQPKQIGDPKGWEDDEPNEYDAPQDDRNGEFIGIRDEFRLVLRKLDNEVKSPQYLGQLQNLFDTIFNELVR